MFDHHNCSTIGIDIGKDFVDFFFLNRENQRERGRSPRSPKALAALAQQLREAGGERVVIEATGGLETLVWAVLESAGLKVCLVNPQRVREFARALGRLAKTDPTDAEVLSLFGDRIEPPVTPRPGVEACEQRELVRRREALANLLGEERVRLQQTDCEAAAASVKRTIEWMSGEIKRVEQDLRERLEAMPAPVRKRAKRLRSAPGVGEITAWTLLAELPELGTISGREAAALAGLAPWARESGRYRGRRCIGGGRARVRRALYLAAWSAVRADRGLAAFRERLLATGKAKQLVTIAVARKLLVALNAMLRDDSSWKSAPA